MWLLCSWSVIGIVLMLAKRVRGSWGKRPQTTDGRRQIGRDVLVIVFVLVFVGWEEKDR